MKHLILVLLFTAAAGAQPLEGPFELLNTQGLTALTNPRVVVRDENRADVFWQTGDTVFHAAISPQTGNFISAPTSFPIEGIGWIRKLRDVVATADGWAALVYDDTGGSNRTIVFRGLDALDSGLVVDTGIVMCSGEWVSISRNHALSLSPRADGGFFASWLNEWAFDNPWHFGEAGSGPVALSFVSGDSILFAGNVYLGPWPEVDSPVEVFQAEADSDIVLVPDHSGIFIYRPAWQGDWWNMNLRYLCYFNHGADNVGSLCTNGGTLFLVSHSFSSRPAELLRIDNLSSLTVAQILDNDPIAAASHPDFGIAWLVRYGMGLVLYRADTTGALIFPAGAIHWPSEGFEITEAALALSDDGLLVAIWTERETQYAEPTIMRMASVGWNTYLDAEQESFILHPSSFSLSTFPNPFNSTLQIEYEMPKRAEIELSIHNVLGQRVEVLESGMTAAGAHRTSWSPASAGGIYFVTLRYDGQAHSRKVLYLR